MMLAGTARSLLLGSLLATTVLLAGCGGEIKVPEVDQATAEQKRQEYEEMIKKERMNQ